MEATAILTAVKFKGIRTPIEVNDLLYVRLGEQNSIDGYLQENAEVRVTGFDFFDGADEPAITGVVTKNDDSLRYPAGTEVTFDKEDITD